MNAVTAPASIRVQVLDVIVRHTGPISLQRRLTEAGDAMLVATVIMDLEAAFGVELDDFWRGETVDGVARLVETLMLQDLEPAPVRAVNLAAERARRARAPMFPGPNIRDVRLRARAARRRRDLATVGWLLTRAAAVGSLAAVGAFAFGWA